MKTERIEACVVLIFLLTIGVFLSYHLEKGRPGPAPAINPDIVTVDIIREGDDILIYEHCSGELVFEYNRLKEADKEAWIEYNDLLIEVRGK